MPPRDPYAPPRDPPEPSDVFGWLFPREPRRLALLFLGVLLLCLAGGGALALLLRGELANPERDLVSAKVYNQVFTLHGFLLSLVFLWPAIPATLGYFAVPRQVGAVRVPWAGWVSFYAFVVSVGLVVAGTYVTPPFVTGELPLIMTLGLTGLVLSAVLTAFALVLTGLRGRTRIGAMPLFTGSIVLGAIAMLVTVAVALLAPEPDPLAGWGVVPGLATIPALGVVCEILEVHARGLAARRLVFVALVVLAAVSVPLWRWVGEGAWIAHLLGRLAVMFLLCAWTVPLVRQRPVSTPLVYALAIVVTLLLAGFTGAVLSALKVDIHLADTYFVVGDFHLRAYVVLLAFLGGLHHWWHDLTGRQYNETAGRVGAALVWLGMTIHAVAMLVLGHEGMPRRYYTYLPEFTDLHRIATLGAVLLACGLLWAAGTLARSVRDPPSKLIAWD